MKQKTTRDPRLDFFRGLGMFIILIAHIPWNPWTEWIPARFGFSDAADLFVFCSGLASGLAFAPVFVNRGWTMGAARIFYRVWQVYWAHIGGFFVVVAVVAAADARFGDGRYAASLELGPFFADFKAYATGLMTLRYIPAYFDILPMYLAILAMIPVVAALAAFDRRLVAIFVVATWLAANAGLLNLTADPQSGREWFFNPFGWQLVFFTGFAFARGWLQPPPRDRRLALAAGAVVLLAAPVSCQSEFACHAGYGAFPILGAIHEWLGPAINKPNIGFLRYVHFMATAYLAFMLAGPLGRNLRGAVVETIRRVGQQTLAVFLTGLVAAQILGMILDVTGRGFVASTLVNALGIAILIAAARIVSWIKSDPWRNKVASAPISANLFPALDAGVRDGLAASVMRGDRVS